MDGCLHELDIQLSLKMNHKPLARNLAGEASLGLALFS
jgi:hypothetical protein